MAALLKIFLGLALVHFQKYWLLRNYFTSLFLAWVNHVSFAFAYSPEALTFRMMSFYFAVMNRPCLYFSRQISTILLRMLFNYATKFSRQITMNFEKDVFLFFRHEPTLHRGRHLPSRWCQKFQMWMWSWTSLYQRWTCLNTRKWKWGQTFGKKSLFETDSMVVFWEGHKKWQNLNCQFDSV